MQLPHANFMQIGALFCLHFRWCIFSVLVMWKWSAYCNGCSFKGAPQLLVCQLPMDSAWDSSVGRAWDERFLHCRWPLGSLPTINSMVSCENCSDELDGPLVFLQPLILFLDSPASFQCGFWPLTCRRWVDNGSWQTGTRYSCDLLKTLHQCKRGVWTLICKHGQDGSPFLVSSPIASKSCKAYLAQCCPCNRLALHACRRTHFQSLVWPGRATRGTCLKPNKAATSWYQQYWARGTHCLTQ